MFDTAPPGKWNFDLTKEQEARAARLHKECIIVDMVYQGPGGANIYETFDRDTIESHIRSYTSKHSDLVRASMLPYELSARGVSNAVKDWWELSGVTLGPVEIKVASETSQSTEPSFEKVIDDLPWVRLVACNSNIKQAKKENIFAVYGYYQPVFGLPNCLSAIDNAHDRGLRVLMLTYNRMDYVGGGCTERNDIGLSLYGIDVVRRCNELGIVIDTSHCSKQTTLEACKYSTQPVIANHTSAETLCAHPRSKSDDEIRAIADTGGLIGVVTVPDFLSTEPSPTIESVLDHIDYIVELVGWEHVGIGTDWPLQAPKTVLKRVLAPIMNDIGFGDSGGFSINKTLRGFDDYRDMPNLTRGLVRRGYDDTQIRGVLGENFLRVFGAVCG